MEKIVMSKVDYDKWYKGIYKTTKIKSGTNGKSITIKLPNNYNVSFCIKNLGVKGAKDKLFEKFNNRVSEFFTIQ